MKWFFLALGLILSGCSVYAARRDRLYLSAVLSLMSLICAAVAASVNAY